MTQPSDEDLLWEGEDVFIITCRNCHRIKRDHGSTGKCLFEATSWDYSKNLVTKTRGLHAAVSKLLIDCEVENQHGAISLSLGPPPED